MYFHKMDYAFFYKMGGFRFQQLSRMGCLRPDLGADHGQRFRGSRRRVRASSQRPLDRGGNPLWPHSSRASRQRHGVDAAGRPADRHRTPGRGRQSLATGDRPRFQPHRRPLQPRPGTRPDGTDGRRANTLSRGAPNRSASRASPQQSWSAMARRRGGPSRLRGGLVQPRRDLGQPRPLHEGGGGAGTWIGDQSAPDRRSGSSGSPATGDRPP